MKRSLRSIEWGGPSAKLARLGAILTLGATACTGGGDDGFAVPDHCNPMGSTACLVPWPSSAYAVDDASTRTGRRLAIAEGALPTSADGIPIDPAMFNDRDGFSAAAPIITAFPGGVDPANLVHFTDFAASVTDASPTVILDMTHGGRVVHFAELDAPEADEPDRQALFLRPAKRLLGGTRYAVGIRKTLKARGGGDLPVPEGYQAVLDDRTTDHPLLERVRPHYEDIFAAFAAEGISPTELIVAWDFTTASDESMQADVLAARDVAMPVMGDAGTNLGFVVESDGPHSDERIRRRIDGTFEAPLFLTQDGAYAPGTELARDAAGNPQMMGMYDIPFTAIVPECAYSQAPVPILLYGHGLLGKAADQVTSGALRTTADALCMVVIGTDMRGMSESDLPNVFLALNDLNKGNWVYTTLVQGVVNHIALEQIVRGPMATALLVDDAGDPLVDPTRVYFYGLSQGHIFGSTIVAYDPFIERAAVGVGGANYSMMLDRSANWPIYKTTLMGAYPNPLDVTICINLMQMAFDFTDPATTSPGFVVDGVPGTPPKQLLMHMAMGDAQVSNISSEYQARTMGVPVLAPTPYEPYGIPAMAGPLEGSAFVIYDGGDRAPLTNEPPEDNEAHFLTRDQQATFRQMKTFYDTGVIVNECAVDGVTSACDCTVGACD
jgi:hypothetical protein